MHAQLPTLRWLSCPGKGHSSMDGSWQVWGTETETPASFQSYCPLNSLNPPPSPTVHHVTQLSMVAKQI